MPSRRIAAITGGLYAPPQTGIGMTYRTGTIQVTTTLVLTCLAVVFAPAGRVALAQDGPPEGAMREAHAVLLGLSQDGAEPERDAGSDIYYSIMENPNAPRLVTRLEVSGAPCRARTTSALQFPGRWATLTLGLVDLSRITSVMAYASVDDMIAGTRPVAYDSAQAEQVVLTGEGLYCSSRMSLSGQSNASDDMCSDRLDLPLMDEDQRARGRKALRLIAEFCKAPAFSHK
jgi:hypothetical protein